MRGVVFFRTIPFEYAHDQVVRMKAFAPGVTLRHPRSIIDLRVRCRRNSVQVIWCCWARGPAMEKTLMGLELAVEALGIGRPVFFFALKTTKAVCSSACKRSQLTANSPRKS